jgi:hypothetical protein
MVDRRLAILVFTSTMLSVSRHTAFESLVTCSANSSNHAYYSTSLAKMACWSSFHFLSKILLAVVSALVFKAKD